MVTSPHPNAWAAGIAVLASAFPLGLVLALERWGGLVPCALCLWERWPYRIAIVLSLLVAFSRGLSRRAALGLLTIVIAGAAILAAIHVGVEQGLWPSPLPECAAPRLTGGSIAERLSRMPVSPAKPCDEPTFLLPFLPLSLAALNLVYALAFLGFLAISSWRMRGERK
jgi:disulfide bond formation protein DsbB